MIMLAPTTQTETLPYCLVIWKCLEWIGLDENVHYKKATTFQYLPHRGIWDTTVSP